MASLLFLLYVFLTGCEAQATPIAIVTEPTSQAEISVTATNPPNLRYGLFANTEGYVSDLAEIQNRASVETFYELNRATEYDIVAAYGVFEAWQVSPVRQHLALVINPNLAPMDNEIIRALIPQMIDTRALIESLAIQGIQPNAIVPLPSASIRTSLANEGYPDGLELTLAVSPLLGLETILAEFDADNISIQVTEAENAIAENRAHLALVIWTDEAPLGDVIELYNLPISYLVKEGIQIEFSESGWPLPR